MRLVDEMAELFASGTELLYLVTEEEDRALDLCEQAARAAGFEPAVWSSGRGLEPFLPEARKPLELLEALLSAPSPLVCALLDFHRELGEPRVARRLRDLLGRLAVERKALCIIAPRLLLPEGLAREATVLRLPLPGEEELLEVLDAAALAQSGQTSQAGRLAPLDPEARQRASVSAAGLSLSQARRTFVRALRADPALGDAAQALISGEKLRALERDLGLVHVPLVEGPDDLGGLAGFKAWIAERGQAFGPGARAYGLPAPRGVLLVGVQGCGKSLAAKVAAVQLGVPLVRLDLPRVLGAGDGAEESLRRALEAAEANAPLAMWIDEIEKAFAGSGQGEGSDPRSARLLGAFSTWLQERPAPVFVVATANDVSRLPPELMRRGRFDELFFVDLPDLEARRTILALHLRRRGRPPDEFDLQEIALLCEGYSGAELEQVVVGGLHRAFGLHRELVTQDLRRVAQDLVPLYRTYEEQIKALREWARGRARTAGREGAVVDLFRRLEGAAPTVPSV